MCLASCLIYIKKCSIHIAEWIREGELVAMELNSAKHIGFKYYSVKERYLMGEEHNSLPKKWNKKYLS